MSDSNEDVLQRILHYTPNKPAAGIAAGIYFVIASSLFVRLIKARAWWGLCLPIASIVMATGFVMRIIATNNPNSLGLYICQQLMIILSPAAFLAFNYILYGIFIRTCVGREHSWINPDKVGRLFVISDIVTFLVQATGGSMQASHSVEAAKNGSNIFLAGLVLQGLSYLTFVYLVYRAHRSIKRSPQTMGQEVWWKIFWVLYFSSIFILIRCVYRLVEGAQGYNGYLLTHEPYFYVFDSIPLALAIIVYVPFWPSKYLVEKSSGAKDEYGMVYASNRSSPLV